MKNSLRVLAGLGAILLVGCSGGSGGSLSSQSSNAPSGGTDAGPGSSAAKASPGGYWEGANSDGGLIAFLVAEDGRFHVLDADLSQGSGTLVVGSSNDVEGNFLFVTQPGSTFADGTTSATCSLSGNLSERQAMSITADCRTSGVLRIEFAATLGYSDVYENASSLATIAGNYQGSKTVLNITGDGTVFSQDPGTGCIVNGQVNIIDSAFNAYDLNFTYSNCTGTEAAMNGTSFAGIVLIDDRVVPQELDIAAIGNLDGDAVSFEGNFVSFVETLERL
jgi:hypothetical protein